MDGVRDPGTNERTNEKMWLFEKKKGKKEGEEEAKEGKEGKEGRVDRKVRKGWKKKGYLYLMPALVGTAGVC